MENEKQQYRQREQQRRAQSSPAGGPGVCSNCGARVAPGARFCEECGAPQGAHMCVTCGAEIDPKLAICPVCGHPATTNCTFCGCEMSAGEAFCPDCGNSRSGIECPHCRTLNFRNFCRTCNYPLNPMALYAVEQAKADPRYQRASRIAQEMAEMEDEMERLEQLIAAEKAAAAEPTLQIDDSVSEETRRLMEEFERLSQNAPGRKRPVEQLKPQAKTEEPRRAAAFDIAKPSGGGGDVDAGGPRGDFSDAVARLEQLKQQYREKAAEFQKEVDAMIPDPADPPEIQRNFVCAHMITTRTKTYTVEKRRVAWVCNKCHIFHNNPSECGVAEFGGKWVTQDVRVETETTSQSSINI